MCSKRLSINRLPINRLSIKKCPASNIINIVVNGSKENDSKRLLLLSITFNRYYRYYLYPIFCTR